MYIQRKNSIWEMGSKEYADKHLKLKSWMEIGSCMYLDWNELEKNGKDERGKKITHTYLHNKSQKLLTNKVLNS